MRQRTGHDAEMADYRARQAVAARPAAQRGEVLPAHDSRDGPLGPPVEDRPATYRYSSIEERWEIRLRPDGSARASVVVRRQQQVDAGRRWHFVARRGLPAIGWERARLWLTAAGATLAALVAGGWLAWSAWSRPAPQPQPQTVTIAMPPPTVMMAPPPPAAPPSALRSQPQPPAPDPVRADTPRVPVVLPPPPQRDEVAPPAPSAPAAAPDKRPLDRRPAVQAAIARAFASGEPEAWAEGDLTGFVVVGPAEIAGGASCRNTVVLVRGALNGDRTVSRRRCQAANGTISVREAS